jgi:hypothetical protein
MSQQQMQSFEPEPPREREGYERAEDRIENTDPREQQMLFEGPYYGQKLRPLPPQPKPRRNLWFLWLLVPALLVFLVAAPMGIAWSVVHQDGPRGIYGFAKPAPGPNFHFQGKPLETFQVSGAPTVVINDPAGNVTVHVGDDNFVTLNSPSLFGPSDGGGGQVQTSQSNDGNTINVTVPDGLGSFGGALDVTVPANANIEIQSRTGTITIEGVNGQVTAQTESGSISVINSELSGASTLQSQSGSINFQGSLDPQGDYQFISDSGSVNLLLPADASFHLDASHGSGAFNNAFGSNNVGNGGPTVAVRSDTGSINIGKD